MLSIGILLTMVLVAFGMGVWEEMSEFEREDFSRQIQRLSQIARMSNPELVDYVADLLREKGFEEVRSANPRPPGVFQLVAREGDAQVAIMVVAKSALTHGSASVPRSRVASAVNFRWNLRCEKAMVVTNGGFTEGAERLAEAKGCRLIAGEEIRSWATTRDRRIKGLDI